MLFIIENHIYFPKFELGKSWSNILKQNFKYTSLTILSAILYIC